MQWSIKYAASYEGICEAYEQFKDDPTYKIPAAIAERPELGLLDAYYLGEFYTLGTERVNAMSEGAITVTRIRERAVQVDDDDIEMYEQIILSVDRAYLHMRYEESEKERKRNEKK